MGRHPTEPAAVTLADMSPVTGWHPVRRLGRSEGRKALPFGDRDHRRGSWSPTPLLVVSHRLLCGSS